MNVYGVTLEIGRYVKSENVMYGSLCKQHRFANLKVHFYKWTVAHMFPLGRVNAKDAGPGPRNPIVEE